MGSSNQKWFYLLLGILVFIAAIPFHLNPDNFVADDAYFYLQVAHNIAAGEGSTFHTITPTNGYHPLWMLFCVAGAFLANGDKVFLLHLMAVIQVGLFVLSLYYFWRIQKFFRQKYFEVAIAYFAILMLVFGGLRLFEAHLAIALQLVLLLYFCRLVLKEQIWSTYASFGCVLALILSARLDMIFFVGSCWIVINFLNLYGENRVRNFLLTSAPAAIFGGGYLLFNWITYGHFVTVSGEIKSHFPIFAFDLGGLGVHGLIVVFSALGLLSLAFFTSKQEPLKRLVFGTLFVGVFLHALYVAGYSWGTQWYYTTAYIAIPLAGAELLTRFVPWRSVVRTCAVGILCLGTSLAFLKVYYNFSIVMVALGKQKIKSEVAQNNGLEIARLINEYLPKGVRVAVFDAPGVMAYYSHAKIFPLDGLMNDYEYGDELERVGANAYFSEREIAYYLGPEKEKVRIYSPFTKEIFGEFELREEAKIFEGPNPVREIGGMSSPVTLWKI